MTVSWPLWHSNSVRNQLLFTVKPQTVVANLAYHKDASSRPVNYSILNSFGSRSQYINPIKAGPFLGGDQLGGVPCGTPPGI